MTKASFEACGAVVYFRAKHLDTILRKSKLVSRIVRQSKIGELP
ncbi:MAG: hypothetical protein ACREDD_12025 [Methylocella sp.]